MPDTDIKGKVTLVTGAAGGIGRALVRAFVEAGVKVAASDVSREGVAHLESEYGRDRVLGVQADVSDYASCRASVEQTAAHFGALHFLVNNAALGMGVVREDHFTRTVQIEDIKPEIWQKMIAVNLTGPFFMAHVCVPRFRAQRFGRIINITTSFFTMLNPGFSPYWPAKSGLEAWSASLAGELKGSGVTVNVVVPGGPTDTPMVPEASGIDRGAMIRPEQMAYPMLYLFSEKAGDVTGRRFVAAHWDPKLGDEAAAAKAGAPAAWPDLAQNPVWPGGKPAR